jgi:hypothetical protein
MDRLLVEPIRMIQAEAIIVINGSRCVRNNLGRLPSNIGQLLRQHPFPDKTVLITSVLGVSILIDCVLAVFCLVVIVKASNCMLPNTHGNISIAAIDRLIDDWINKSILVVIRFRHA